MSAAVYGESSTAGSRIPLATLPLYRFVDPATSQLFASPTSIPSKRAPPTPEGERSTKNARMVTPKVKAVLDRDDLGMGKSPARRLFPDESGVSPGISGASPLPASPIIRRLAPSPPIHSSPSAASSSRQTSYFPKHPSPSPRGRADDFEEMDQHDPGFSIHHDQHLVGLGTPQSRRTLSEPPLLPLPTPSPSGSIGTNSDRWENQENIPPLATPSSSQTQYYSAKSSPTTHPASEASGSSNGWPDQDEDTLLAINGFIGVIVAESSPMTAGRKRTGKSKLAQVIDRDASSEPDEEVDELTPGRTLREAKGKGKERLAREVEG